MAKINIRIDDELLERMDKCRKARYLSRSGFITMSITDKITQIESVSTLSLVADTLEKISNKTDVDEDVKAEIDELVKVSKMLLLGLDR